MAMSMSQVSRVDAAEPLVPAGVRSLTGFGARLFGELLRGAAPTTNVVCSPYSIFTALAMARAGAVGDTAAAMDAALGVTDPDRLPGQLNALTQTLAARAGERRRGDRSSASITWHEANSLWGQAGMTWREAFLDTLAASYGTGMRDVDYVRDAEAARGEINAWTAEATRDLIPEIVPAGALTPATRLVLVNALYLLAPWERRFLAHATSDAPFTRADGTRVTVAMMRAGKPFAAAQGDGWVAARLPYAGSELAMAVILPDVGAEADTRAVVSSGGAEGLDGVLAAVIAGGTSATLEMPRMKLRTAASLGDALTSLGMGVAFSDAADFSGMTAEERLVISRVLHEAVVAVDEEGTEAAAATAVLMERAMAPAPPPLTIVLDRPFYLVIHDVATAAPLFLGYVGDPAART